MAGNFIDVFRLRLKKRPSFWDSNIKIIETDYGRIRVWDTQGNNPVIINVPDGPNVIEHQSELVEELSKTFRVICFEFPGLGFSYPSSSYDYSFERSAKIILHLMDVLNVNRACLSFSCSNGYYAIKAAQLAPHRIIHLFLAQTPSLYSMKEWMDNNIPKILTFPIIGQLVNSLQEKKMTQMWYKYALPKETDSSVYKIKALKSLSHGGCFCLSSLVQGISKEINTSLITLEVSSTLAWGSKDYTHRKTNKNLIFDHLPNCEVVEFDKCGHFPDLENTRQYVKLVNEKCQFVN